MSPETERLNAKNHERNKALFSRQESLKLRGIELVAINSKGTGSLCSACGSEGSREKQDFRCESCGYTATVAQNTARNIEKLAALKFD